MTTSFMVHKVSQRSNSCNLLAYFLLFLYPSPMPKDDHRTVWSSEQGDLRKQKTQLARMKSLPPTQQTAYLHRESKGRGGKTVTLVKNLILSEADLKSLSKRLKQVCSSGGTVKDGLIEIQGEHRKTIAETLEELGYRVKTAGG
jgi:translation initiation factor 1